MKKVLLLLLSIILLTPTMAGASDKRKTKKANEATQEWRYELEAQTTGLQGTKVVRVWSFSKDPKIAQRQAPKNALHGIMFKGAPGNKDTRVTQILPLITDPSVEAKNAEFFDAFFADGGDFMRYVTVTSGADELQRIEKKMYKVGVVVTIQYDALRKMLEEKGIAKKLNSGF